MIAPVVVAVIGRLRASKGQRLAAGLLLAMCAPVAATGEHYRIDPSHTFPSLEFSHLGISFWRGKFDRSRGEITLDRAAGTGTVDVRIDPSSINFGLAAMDEKARSEEWFDVARYPEARYRGDIVFADGIPHTVEGVLRFRDVERPVRLDITHFKCIPHPMLEVEVCGADARGALNWSEFGMQHSEYGQGEAGHVLLRIQVEAIRQED